MSRSGAFVNLTHLHGAERDGANRLAIVSESVVAESMIHPADN